jgi:hypothetical protein
MLLTEEEAKKRWCPFAKYASAGPHPSWPTMPTIIAPEGRQWAFAQDSYAFPQKCIASECMAFRLMPQMYRHTTSGGSYASKAKANAYGVEGEPVPRVGFCGLASVPHNLKGG